jgi:hypothetical protein
MMKKPLSAFIIVITLVSLSYAHSPAAVAGGGTFGGAGIGRSFSGVSIFATNDSALVSMDLFSNFAYSLQSQLREGEPLGTGGTISNTYNTYMYRTATSQAPFSLLNSTRLQQYDFGYIPIWQPSGMSARLKSRFLNNLWGTVVLDLNVNDMVDNVKSATANVSVGALNVTWAPKAVPNLNINIGRVHCAGTYVALFDQMPLENTTLNGMTVDYNKYWKEKKVFLSTRLAGGQQFMGRTVSLNDTVGTTLSNISILGAARNRNVVLGRIFMGLGSNLSLKLIGGYQATPGDSTEVSILGTAGPIVERYYLPFRDGWHAGLEIAHTWKTLSHNLLISYGKGDVGMAWGGPDYVNQPRDDSYLRDALTYGLYWGNLRVKKLSIDFGVWGLWRNPPDDPVRYTFNNSDWVSDSNGQIKWTDMFDTLSLSAQDYWAVKFSLAPSIVVARRLRVGLRYDHLQYLTPKAHSNIFELTKLPRIDPMDPYASDHLYQQNQPALWEKESINTDVISPQLSFDLYKTLELRGAYSFAFYDKPVKRQNRWATMHSNLTLGAIVTYRFAKLREE